MREREGGGERGMSERERERERGGGRGMSEREREREREREGGGKGGREEGRKYTVVFLELIKLWHKL